MPRCITTQSASSPARAHGRRAPKAAVAVATGLSLAWLAALAPATPGGDAGIAYAQSPTAGQSPAQSARPPVSPPAEEPTTEPPTDPGDAPISGPQATANGAVKGSFIVMYKKSVKNAEEQTRIREARLHFANRYVYDAVFAGFAAQLSGRQVRALRADPKVALVSPDRRVNAANTLVPLVGNDGQPSGVLRTIAGTRPAWPLPKKAGVASAYGVAVLDTGIKSQPDLNVGTGKTCIGSGLPNDLHGHGTHVAGTIAAINQGSGLTGVAPGTVVHPLKVLNDQGGGTFASVICGLNWVMAHRIGDRIGVVNMSLGGRLPSTGTCASDPFHQAICTLTNAQTAPVNVVAAAGNNDVAFDQAGAVTVPAAYPEVFTVTAASDSNGRPLPAGAAPSCMPSQADDKAASFSNYASTYAGMEHTIAAPGVCILSTGKGAGNAPAVMSGTSMAAPHMAAEVALCMNGATPATCAGKTPAQIIKLMRDQAADYNLANPNYGFTGDPQHGANQTKYYGFLYRTLPPIQPVCSPNFFALDVKQSTPIASSPYVQVTSANGVQRTLAINFKPSIDQQCKEAGLVVEYEGLPTGWTVDIGDSATNDGYGGGSFGTTGSCAEVYVANVPNSVLMANKHCHAPQLAAALPLLPTPSLLSLRDGALKFLIRDQFLSAGQPYATPATSELPNTFHIPDTIGPNPDGYKIYTGINRVINQGSPRVGTGVRRVYIVMQ
jgi:subtilisin